MNTIDPQPRYAPGGYIPPANPTPSARPRTFLEKTRDVLLSLMALLVSVICVLVLFVGFSAFNALTELGKNDPAATVNFDPVPTNSAGEECIGEEPPSGC